MRSRLTISLLVVLLGTSIVLLTSMIIMNPPEGSATNYHNAKHHVAWVNDIDNPANEEFVVEVAFNEGIDTSKVTQDMFNARYVSER